MVRAVGPYASYIVQTIVTLLAVCAIAFVVLYGARRLGVGRPRGPIELVGLLPLDARRAIYLVKVAGQVIVVGASEAGFTKLGELSSGDLPEPARDETTSFAHVFSKVLGREIDGACGQLSAHEARERERSERSSCEWPMDTAREARERERSERSSCEWP